MTIALRKSDKSVHRETKFQPGTLDEEARTVEVIAATETAVRRWYGNEVIRCTKASIDASRLDGIKILDSHNRSTILATLGRAIGWRIADRKLYVTIKFADTDAGRQAFDLVQQGMIDKVSVGYDITAAEESERGEDFTLTATRWTPYEVSLVSVPADDNAKIRGKTMSKRMNRAAHSAPADDVIDIEEEGDIDFVDNPTDERGIAARKRNVNFQRQLDELRLSGVRAGLQLNEIDAAFSQVKSIAEARTAIFDQLAARSLKAGGNNSYNPSANMEDGSTATGASRLDDSVVDAIAVRFGAAPLNENNPLRGQSMIEIGRHFFAGIGADIRTASDDDIGKLMLGERSISVRGAYGGHTTSDFPMLLEQATNRALLERFTALASVIKTLSKERRAADFRPRTFIRPGEAPALQRVGESGELKRGTLGTEYESLKISTFGRVITLTRQAIINDDLGAFDDILGELARISAVTEADEFYELLSANAFGGIKLSDGKNFFHADHGNIAAAGTVIDVTNVGKAREAMRKQRNVNDSAPAGAAPAVILVGPAKETEAELLVASITAATRSDANPFSGKLKVLVEDRIPDNRWYLFADPVTRPALMHAYLDGSRGPQVDSQDGFDVLGRHFRCVHDFGCGVQDYRAAYMNPGA